MTLLIIISAASIGGLGLFFGIILGIAAKFFKTDMDSRIKDIEEILPGINCGACGFPGCSGYAKALVKQDVDISLCIPGASQVQARIAAIMGKETKDKESLIAKVRCVGDKDTVARTGYYLGVKSCSLAQITVGGDKACAYGCLGYGDCAAVCPFDAIHMGKDKLPHVDEKKCTGCGLCVKACPRNIIEMVNKRDYFFIKCVSKDFGPAVSKVCKKGCIGCGICARVNNNEGIRMENNLPVVDHKEFKGDVTGAQKCPTRVIEFLKEKWEEKKHEKD
ncbi:MAG: RnfABCDGE type electron transport complex subunit B [Spirochaetes bacterium]|nr:RnfABCDGE type electron transport complex subunit B [Spirochaetota bacterium]